MKNLFGRNNRVRLNRWGRPASWLLTLVTFAALSLVPTSSARAQAQTFGSVNVEEVAQKANVRQSDLKELGGLAKSLQEIFDNLSHGPGQFLSDAELRELAGLYEKKTPTDADKKRISTLEDAGNNRKRELTTLESNAAPTDDQRRRFNDLTGIGKQGQINMQSLGEEYQKRLGAREGELTIKTNNLIRDAIAAVAKARNLTVVFNSNLALYTTNDITSDVIKQINK